MDNTIEIKYGLYHIKKECLLGYFTSSNGEDCFCNDETVTLSASEDNVWLVDDDYVAEYTRQFEQYWYNSSYDTPVCTYKPEELKVIKVKIEKEYELVDINIPTPYEFYKDKYEENNPRHWERMQKGEIPGYDIYEMENYLERTARNGQ